MTQDNFPTGRGDGEGPLRRESLHQQIYARLRRTLLAGGHRPGEILSSRVLAERLGVSAMPVREALTRLTAEGALEQTFSRTLRVRVLTVADFDELTAIRLSLEPMAAHRAATQAGAEDRATIEACHAALCQAAASGRIDDYIGANAAFHRAIYTAAGWPILHSTIERLWMIVGPSIRACLPDTDHITMSMHFHNAARLALLSRNDAALADAIAGDIRAAACDIRRYLKSVALIGSKLETEEAME